MTTSLDSTSTTDTDARSAQKIFSALTGVCALLVVLQGLWAGLFLRHDGERDAAGKWIDWHARGGEVAIFFALAALVWAVVKLRSRRDLLAGTAVLIVALFLESYLGGVIRDNGKDNLTAVHVPLAMLILALAVWLPLRARRSN